MKVKELIKFLEGQDPELRVIYSYCSDYTVLELRDIVVKEYHKVRADGYVHTHGMNDLLESEKETFIVFPGN